MIERGAAPLSSALYILILKFPGASDRVGYCEEAEHPHDCLACRSVEFQAQKLDRHWSRDGAGYQHDKERRRGSGGQTEDGRKVPISEIDYDP